MKKIIYFFFITILFTSCTRDINDYPYYQFTSYDYEHIPTIYKDIGKIIKFKNENNQELSFVVKDYKHTRLAPAALSYDVLYIKLESLNNNNCNTTFSIQYKKTTANNLELQFGQCQNPFITFTNPFNELKTIEINNKTYNKVMVLYPFSPIYTPQNPNSVLAPKIFFDLENGLIGFNGSDNLDNYKIVSN